MLTRQTIGIMALALALMPIHAQQKVKITADNSIVLYPGEQHLNAGSKPRIRIKGNQHLVALQFDLTKLKGKPIKSATLVYGKADKDIQAVSISTIACPWEEKSSSAVTSGAAKFKGWGIDGLWFPEMTGSNAFTLTCFSRSKVVNGFYHWQVAPDLIYANAIGAAHGLTIHEADSDYSRNPTVFSKEDRQHAPYLLVELGGRIASPGQVKKAAIRFVDGVPVLRIKPPANAFTYQITVNGKALPQWNIPFALPTVKQMAFLRDVSVRPGQNLKVSIRAVNRLGQTSSPNTISAKWPAERKAKLTSVPAPKRTGNKAKYSDLSIIPVLDKYDQNGKPVGDLPPDYRTNNPIYDGSTIRLEAAKGEVVGFQALAKGTGNQKFSCDIASFRTDIFTALYVDAHGRQIPDPLIAASSADLSKTVETPIIVDIYVPFNCSPGIKRGTFKVGSRTLPIELKVFPYTLPKEASFYCEMNSYGLPDRASQFYRLQQIAYDHRLHCNILHYSHSTAAPGSRQCVMDMRMDMGKGNDRRMDEKKYNDIKPGAKTTYWRDFVDVFGPYLSGEYFAKGHRGPIPSPGFYLTFHESWPLHVRSYFNGDPDAYEAFKDKPIYAKTFTNLLADFIKLAKKEKWTKTGFQVYLNNKGALKNDRKAPWILDEPTSFWDYRALRFYGELVRQTKGKNCPIQLDYRIDISRPQFDRGELWNCSDLWVVNGQSFLRYPRLLQDRRLLSGEEMWIYGTTNRVEDCNRITHAWVLDAFRQGATGVVPWQTVNKDGKAMKKADQLGLFIFADGMSGKTINHSLRLKAFRRAQQDIELLNLLKEQQGLNISEMREFIDANLKLDATIESKYAEDAGTASYKDLSPAKLDEFRCSLRASIAP